MDPPPGLASLCRGSRQQMLLHLGCAGQSQHLALGQLVARGAAGGEGDQAGSVSRWGVTMWPRQMWLGLAVL